MLNAIVKFTTYALLVFLSSAFLSSVLWARADPSKPNKLAGESSPYLRDHADNPVDWFPWGDEAFEKARRENKPILLSIGYSTCLYCHVMERESYSNKDISDLLNENFVAIKVDREQRPDIDETFILATQFFSGNGGWPNNVFLTPDLKPFYGGLYFPPAEFAGLLHQITQSWNVQRNAIVAEADRVSGLIHQVMQTRRETQAITPEALAQAVQQSLSDFDVQNGGFGTSPKMTNENLLLLLMTRGEVLGDQKSLNAALATLDAMIKGSIRDQVGGGFHRYTIDTAWRTPNLEMMLFNQAGMARALLQAYRISGKARYGMAARNLLDFVIRDITSSKGAFFTSLDPELSVEEEVSQDGMHYTWTEKELEAALNPDELSFARRAFTLNAATAFGGRRVLSMKTNIEDFAAKENKDTVEVYSKLNEIREKLRLARSARLTPRRDEKVLAGWNGMMIMALAEGATIFDDPDYRKAAVTAAEFLWTEMEGSTGKLKRSFFKGVASNEGTQPDYVFAALGFVAIYDATQESIWLERANTLSTAMNERFLDTEINDYFINQIDNFYRPKMIADAETPSGNAAAIDLFNRLMRRDGNPNHRSMAEKITASMSGNILSAPRENLYGQRAAIEFLHSEVGAVQMAGKGVLRAAARATAENTVEVKLGIAEGWHINSNKPHEEFFIPTELRFPKSAEKDSFQIEYPKPKILSLKFHDKPLSLLENEVTITAKLQSGSALPMKAKLTVQPCSNSICLEPETLSISILPKLPRLN